MKTTTSTVLMVPPESFAFNNETAATNSFQVSSQSDALPQKALNEFSNMVSILKEQGINVLTLNQGKNLPDAVFPNNWFSTHRDAFGNDSLIIYPMLTKNRQAEVNIDGLLEVLANAGYKYSNVIDLRNENNDVLEGTGSLVLDKENKVLYACLSPRTSYSLVIKVANILGYSPVIFDGVDANNHPVYHTNVIMGLAKHYAIICLESIPDSKQKMQVVDSLIRSNKQIIDISLEQASHMCGNVLELFQNTNRSILILSKQAEQAFLPSQLKLIQNFSKLTVIDVPTIEAVGGGSVRCMMAEIN